MYGDIAVAGTEFAAEVTETVGDLRPTKASRSMNDMVIAKLPSIKSKDKILDQLAKTDEEKAEYQYY